MNRLPAKPRIVPPSAIPIYCKDCGSRATWIRRPERDIYTESSRLLMLSYGCRVCGAKTLRSNDDEQGEKDKQT